MEETNKNNNSPTLAGGTPIKAIVKDSQTSFEGEESSESVQVSSNLVEALRRFYKKALKDFGATQEQIDDFDIQKTKELLNKRKEEHERFLAGVCG